jgi:translation initiation factor 6
LTLETPQLSLIDFNENPNVGIYCRANNATAFIQKGLTKKAKQIVASTLAVTVVDICICDATIIGSLLALNSYGAIVTETLDEASHKKLKDQGLRILLLKDVINAAGNDILANDKGALVHPEIKSASLKKIQDTLGVPVERGSIAGLGTVGMAAVATNKGCLCHPKIDKAETQHLEELFKVKVMIGTVNHGFPMIGSGLVANDHGALIGKNTTGIEMGRIDEALGFLQ